MGGHAPKFVKVTWEFFYIKHSLNSGSPKISNFNFFFFHFNVSAMFWPELAFWINSIKAGVRHHFFYKILFGVTSASVKTVPFCDLSRPHVTFVDLRWPQLNLYDLSRLKMTSCDLIRPLVTSFDLLWP